MKKRVQSSRSYRPWGFFILTGFLGKFFLMVGLWTLLAGGFFPVEAGEPDPMKRRQQGILTGMPFMSNVASRTFVDDMGRKLFLSKYPTRIVSLAPSITEILFAIGLDNEIVGVTEFCDYPPEALSKPKVGYAQPNLESLVALQPDLVLAPQSFLRLDLLEKIEELKIPLFILHPQTVSEILTHIQVIGRMTGRSGQAIEQSTRLRHRMATFSKQIQGLDRPTLLYVLNSKPLITVGPGSFIHHVIELAGGRNAAEDANTPYPRLTMEEVLRKNPDILVFPVGRLEGIPQAEQEAWKRWDTLTAVKEERIFQVESDLLNRPGPRIIEGLKHLRNILHPEVREEEADH